MSEVARRYAAAVFGLSSDRDRFLDTARSVLDCPSLWETLRNPTIDWREKGRVLDRLPLFDGVPELLNFYKLLVRKDRINLLPEIVEAFHHMDLEAKNTAVCQMRCVRVPDEARQEKLKEMLCKLHHRDAVQLEIITDPSLLGGFILTIDGVTYDRSVRSQLRDMARQLQERRMI